MLFENGFFTGLNYWGSESAINMWSNFNKDSIEKDMELMSNAGITHLRVFPLWSVFQPLTALYGPKDVYEYSFGEDPLPDTEAGRAGASEEACQKFKTFCDIAKKYNMKLIVAMITGHMSFRTYNPPAFDGKELLSDPTVIKWQLRFIRYFVNRFKCEDVIVGWDLGNEPIHMPGVDNKHYDAFYVWCSAISYAIKSCDQTRPVISGLDNSAVENGHSNLKTIGEMCDIHTTHPYNIFCTNADPINTMKPILDLPFKCKLSEDVSGVPTFVQEFSSLGYMNCSKKSEAAFYRASLFSSLAHGCHGTMWWCAFDQGHHEFAPYRWNTIGSDYGFFNKDLEEKPIAEENRKFKEVLSLLPDGKLPKHTVNATILIPREESDETDLLRTSYILAKQANIDVNFNYILDPICDSPLYILPSIKDNKAIPKTRLNELMKKVEEGSVLYICADEGLLRQIPEITGVEIEYREKIDATKTLKFNGNEIPVHTTYFYSPESFDGHVAATDENDVPVFFKHAYGKGYVYFLTLPLEAFLANKKGAFFKDNNIDYSCIYRELAKTANIKRICDSDNKYIRLTEHVIDENSLYVVAINYNNKPEVANISVEQGYTVSAIYGNNIENGKIFIKENDAVILKLERTSIKS